MTIEEFLSPITRENIADKKSHGVSVLDYFRTKLTASEIGEAKAKHYLETVFSEEFLSVKQRGKISDKVAEHTAKTSERYLKAFSEYLHAKEINIANRMLYKNIQEQLQMIRTMSADLRNEFKFYEEGIA